MAWENEDRIRRGKPIYTPEEYIERVDWHLSRIPYKLHKARYHSFQRYFHWLKQLGWVEFTGREEPSALQEGYAAAPPRKYYRLTQKGIEVPDYEWLRPQLVLYPHLGLDYFREKRKGRNYTKRAPTKRHRVSLDIRFVCDGLQFRHVFIQLDPAQLHYSVFAASKQ